MKILGRILLILLALVVALAVFFIPIVNGLLDTPLKEKLIGKYAPPEYEIKASDVSLCLVKTLPFAKVTVRDAEFVVPEELALRRIPITVSYLKGGIDLEQLYKRKVISVVVDSLRVSTSGINLSARGRSFNVKAYPDSLVYSATLKADLQKLSKLASSYVEGVETDGDLSIKLDFTESMLSAKIGSDTLSLRLGDQISLNSSGLGMLAQSDFKIIDSLGIPSVLGKFETKSIMMRGQDSLLFILRNSDNVVSVEEQDGLPHVIVKSDASGAFYGSPDFGAGMRDFLFSAKLEMKDGAAKRSRFFRDSLAVRRDSIPAFLSDSTFRAADIDFRLGESVARILDKWDATADLSIGTAALASKEIPVLNTLEGLGLRFKKDVLTLDSLRLRSGASDLSLDGKFRGIKHALSSGGRVSANLNIHSDFIDADEIVRTLKMGQVDSVETKEEADTSALPLIIVPSNIIFASTLSIDSAVFSGIPFFDFRTSLNMKQRCLQISGAHAGTSFGSMDLDAFYSTVTRDSLNTGFNIAFNDIAADQVIQLIPKVDEMIPLLKSFHGVMDFELAATSKLDTNMNFLLPTVNGVFKIRGKDLVIDDYGSLRKLTRTLMFKNNQSGNIDDMSVYGTFSNNVLNIFPFVLGIDRYIIGLNGWQSLDNNYEYHASVLKSPVPFRFGLRIFNKKDKLKFRLESPQFKSKSVPLFNEQVDTIQYNLVSTIRDIYSRVSSESSLDRMRSRVSAIPNVNLNQTSRLNLEDIPEEQKKAYYEMEFKIEADEELEEVNDEIDKLIRKML